MSNGNSPAPAASLEVLNGKQRGVRVDFFWTGDRFAHTISGVREGIAEPLLESIEGESDERFKASPPCVELHQQEEAVFLTGATDAGYWSMTVELAGSLEGPNLGLTDIKPPTEASRKYFVLFDVACRLRAEFGRVGSSYKSSEPNGICVPVAPAAFAASGAREQPYSVVIGPVGLSEKENDCQVICESKQPGPGKLRISPEASAPTAFPATVRWKYGVFWALD